MTVSTPQPKTYSEEEYFALELNSEIRNEYRTGELVPMTGGTPAHNEISSVLNALLRIALKGQAYSIFITDQRLWIPERDLYTYPDAMITPRPAELKPGRNDTVMNPIVIAEVLSESTKGYDRGEKFAAYRTISTFQEYLLIDQYMPHVEHYVKQAENQWLFTEYGTLDQSFMMQSVKVEMALADLYEAIEF